MDFFTTLLGRGCSYGSFETLLDFPDRCRKDPGGRYRRYDKTFARLSFEEGTHGASSESNVGALYGPIAIIVSFLSILKKVGMGKCSANKRYLTLLYRSFLILNPPFSTDP